MIDAVEQRLHAERARQVIREHPWALLVTQGEDGLVASHMPAVLDESAGDELVVLAHVARRDRQAARVERGIEMLVVFQGVHGFLPGAWLGGDGASTGTWNFEAVHVHGTPEPLDRAGSFDVLRRTFEHLEARRPRPTAWADVVGIAEEIIGGIRCFRLPATRVEAKAKLDQTKPPEVRERLIAELERPGPYQHPALAERMRGTLGG